MNFLNTTILIVSSAILIAFVNKLTYALSSYGSGKVFGISVKKSSSDVFIIIILGILQLLFGGYAFSTVFSLLFYNFEWFLIYFVSFIGALVTTLVIGYKSGIKRSAKGKNALVIGKIPMLTSIDEKIVTADTFSVNYSYIGIIKNGKIEKINYADFGYDNLKTESELALLGMYFLQRYHSDFRVKVNTEKNIYPTNDVHIYAHKENGVQGAVYMNANSTYFLKNYSFTRKF